MNRPDVNRSFEQRFRNLNVICIAMALGVVMVNAVLAVLEAMGSLPTEGLSRDVALAIFVVCLLLLASAPGMKRSVFKQAQAGEGFESDPQARLSAYVTGTILSFALREAAGLCGFVLALLTSNLWWSWGAGGAALIAMYADRPRREDLGVMIGGAP
jgi:hypothetical protein